MPSDQTARRSRMNSVLRLVCLSTIALPMFCPTDAFAWGADGHRLVAELAEAQLAPHARAEVLRLLRQEPGATMASVSTWADEVRRANTAPLHYVSLPEGDCTYVRERDCQDGQCVVEAIKDQLAILKSGSTDGERLVALKYVIHLIGDIHQPLHVGVARDKGGNLHQVRAFGRGTNLHAVWDTALILKRAGGPTQLLKDASTLRYAVSPSAEPEVWANASCAVRQISDFYPASRSVDPAYVVRWDATLVERLALAGQHLAEALNKVLIAAE